MLRAILKRSTNYVAQEDATAIEYITVDFENPTIETLLKAGGTGTASFDITNFVGIEVLDETATLTIKEKTK